MKQDKKWLLHEFRKLPCEVQRGHGKVKVVDILPLIDQLDEARKVVIPQFVATFIEDSRNKVGNIVTAIWEMYEHEYKDVYEWALEDGNDEVLMKAFVNGYEVEKEKLYYVIDKSRKPILTTYEGKVIASVSVSKVERAEKLSTPEFKYRLTEKQIKDYDERFWSFAVEVAE